MTEPTKDGGPAFPQVEEIQIDGRTVFVKQTGMTLREYFAGQAVVGMLSNQSLTKAIGIQSKIEKVESSNLISQICYKYADAMLQERSK
jgi:hypothetical protein